MGIHDGDMSFHFFYFDEPVESTFKEYFMNTRYPFRLRQEKNKWRLEVCRKSRKYSCLEVGRTKTTSRIVDDDRIVIWRIESYSYISTLSEKCCQILYTSSLYAYRWLGGECSEYHERSTFDIVVYDSRFCIFMINYRAINDYIMFVVDFYTDSERLEKSYEIHHMWFYGSELYEGLSFMKCCHHEDIFCRCDSRVRSYRDIFLVVFSLECDILTFTHICIPITFECHKMFIYRTLSDITASRVGDIKTSEAREKCRKEEYSDTDFLYLFTIQSMDRHFRSIERYCASFPYYGHAE